MLLCVKLVRLPEGTGDCVVEHVCFLVINTLFSRSEVFALGWGLTRNIHRVVISHHITFRHRRCCICLLQLSDEQGFDALLQLSPNRPLEAMDCRQNSVPRCPSKLALIGTLTGIFACVMKVGPEQVIGEVLCFAIGGVFIHCAFGVHGLLVYIDAVSRNDEACVVASNVGHDFALTWLYDAGV